MSRVEQYKKQLNRQWLAIFMCAVLVFGTPLYGYCQWKADFQHPVFPVHKTNSHLISYYLPLWDGIIGGLIGWAVGKAMDYAYAHWNDPSGCMGSSCVGNASMDGQGAPGSFGGGGGGPW